MNTPTYEQQWQKLTEAYLRGEMQPCNSCCCFIGNLLNGNSDWASGRTFDYTKPDTPAIPIPSLVHFTSKAIIKESNGYYSVEEILNMETIFLNVACNSDDYNEGIFEGMTAALEVLRKIHEAKGDPTAKYITLAKRQLV